MSSPLPSPVNFDAWVAKVKPDLRPPVGNKLLFGDQLKVMVVGGPNSRDDFHIEVGEVRSAVFCVGVVRIIHENLVFSTGDILPARR